MTSNSVLRQITEILETILREKALTPPSLKRETVLLRGGLGIDSLDLARLVTELEERTGEDPFADGFVEFQTIGELAELYGNGKMDKT